MDMDWVVTLTSPSNPTAQITLSQETGSAAPQPNMTIEVDDVDALNAKVRTQEFILRWSPTAESSWRDVVRQAVSFQPIGSH